MREFIDDRIQSLGDALRGLSLIGASLKLRSGNDAEPAIREQIMIGAQAALGRSIGALEEKHVSVLLETIGIALAEAGELFRHPNRAGEWKVADTTFLQTQGQASRFVFRRILVLAETRPLLRKTFDGRLLDVGTGVGGIALEAASSCPTLFVEGIDIWEPALALARQNVSASPNAARITIRQCDVCELADGERYTLVWLPTMFLKRSLLRRALERIVAASLSGSYLVAATYTRPSDPVAASFAALRTLRSGGEVTDASEVEDLLRAHHYVDVESTASPLATLTLGRLS
jgi:SAM-dependent methyltransferase